VRLSKAETNQPNGLEHLLSFDCLNSHVHILTIGYLPSIDEVIIINEPEHLKTAFLLVRGRRRVPSCDFSHKN
jgi:hypothetical protein